MRSHRIASFPILDTTQEWLWEVELDPAEVSQKTRSSWRRWKIPTFKIFGNDIQSTSLVEFTLYLVNLFHNIKIHVYILYHSAYLVYPASQDWSDKLRGYKIKTKLHSCHTKMCFRCLQTLVSIQCRSEEFFGGGGGRDQRMWIFSNYQPLSSLSLGRRG